MSAPAADLVVAITGASGAPYAVRLLQALLMAGRSIHLSISPAGAAVLRQELGLVVDLERFQLEMLLPSHDRWAHSPELAPLRTILGLPEREAADVAQQFDRVRYHHYRDLMAPIASGSALTAGMAICPCSGGTVSAIAHGSSQNLIHRAADVHLKERRKLILTPRETPLSLVQLDNLRRCVEAGAVVLPAMPGYYHGVTGIRSLVDFVVGRILDQLGVPQQLVRRWGD